MKKLLASVLLVSLLCALFCEMQPHNVEATTIKNKEIITETFNWRYLDDHTDPNVGTWYEEWNKRNGWAYPLDFLDWGTIPMRFSDETWADGKAPFSFNQADGGTLLKKKDDGKAGSTYFFRGTFTLDNPSPIVAIQGKIKYNDAVIVYLNGKAIETSLNIPNTNYSQNLEYGCDRKLTEPYEEVTFVIEDVSSLRVGDNVIAVELHTSDSDDTDVYFDMKSFVLNPSADALPETVAVKNVAVNLGETEKQLNFAWYALSNEQSYIQIAKASDKTGDAFPLDKATTIAAKDSGPAYTKFYDKNYYYHKACFDAVERGTNYIYRVGNDAGWSKSYSLNTQDNSKGYEVLFISDPQIGTGTIATDTYGWKNTLDLAFEKYPNVSFIANPGDVVDVATKEGEYDGYFAPEQLTRYPSSIAVGNHDIDKNYSYHFYEPNLSGIGGNAANSDYYYIYENTLFMVLNTNNTNNADHSAFIAQTIEKTKDIDFNWKVVMFHQSIYSAAKQSTIEANITRRNELVPVFDKYEIDIALMGHDHCYVRSHHMKNFEKVAAPELDGKTEIDPEGTLYLTMSSASGSKYYDLVGEYPYSAVQYQLYVPTFSHLTFTDDTFTMTAYRTDTMKVIDEYSMKKTTKAEVDKTELEALLKTAKAIDISLYTDATVKGLNEAIAKAQALLDNDAATQEEVNSQIAQLQEAISILKLKDVPSESSAHTSNVSSENSNKPSSSSTAGTSSDSPAKALKTGDYANYAVYTIFVLGVSASIYVLIKKKKLNNK